MPTITKTICYCLYVVKAGYQSWQITNVVCVAIVVICICTVAFVTIEYKLKNACYSLLILVVDVVIIVIDVVKFDEVVIYCVADVLAVMCDYWIYVC